LTSTAASSRSTRPAIASGAPPRALLVSIHDVAPPLERSVRELWELCQDRGITPALLVVPNWHGDAPLETAPAFTRWIRECAHQGAEVFLHGERHDEQGLGRGWRDAWRASGRTAREGEFLTLDEPRAAERIERGLTYLRRLGLEPSGFVPPAWLARPTCWRAVGRAGLRFSEDAHSVRIHADDHWTEIPSPVVRWSSRTALRAYGSVAVARARWLTQRGAPYVRIALHPGDLDHPRTARSVAVALDHWLSDRPAAPYATLRADARA
jgi:predicted deacetylase